MQNLYVRVIARSLIALGFLVGLHYCLRAISAPSDFSLLGVIVLILLVLGAFKLMISTFVEKEKEDGVRNEERRVPDQDDRGSNSGSGHGDHSSVGGRV